MTDKELKRHLKKVVIGLIIIILIIIALLGYTLGGKKAELSMYTNAEYSDNLQTLGIDQNEFKEYLTVFANLIDDQYNEKQKMLNMATNFMENLYSSNELSIHENDKKNYDANHINNIIKEVQGTYIKTEIADGDFYQYQAEENVYVQNREVDRVTNCVEIDNIEKKGDNLEVIYTLNIVSKEQLAEYMIGQATNFESYKIKAVIMFNTNYEYSKYFVHQIVKL